jgi:hypothetical protein
MSRISVLEKGVCVGVCGGGGGGGLALEIISNFENSPSSKHQTTNVSTIALTRGSSASLVLRPGYIPVEKIHPFVIFVLVQSHYLKPGDNSLIFFSTRPLLNNFWPNMQVAYGIG